MTTGLGQGHDHNRLYFPILYSNKDSPSQTCPETNLIDNYSITLFSDDYKLGHVDNSCSLRQNIHKKRFHASRFWWYTHFMVVSRCHTKLLWDNRNYFWKGDCCSSQALHTQAMVSENNRKSLQLCSFLLLLLIWFWKWIFQKGNRYRKCKLTLKIWTGGRVTVVHPILWWTWSAGMSNG